MSDDSPVPTDPNKSERLAEEVRHRAERRSREAAYRERGFWVGVGTMGLIGWSVVLPAVLGGFFGIWLDGKLGTRRTFSGVLAVAGLCLGCWNAWRMVRNVLDQDDPEPAGETGEMKEKEKETRP